MIANDPRFKLGLTPNPLNAPVVFWHTLRSAFSTQDYFAQIVYERRQEMIPQYKETLADGHVVVHSLQPTAVVQLIQIEDEHDSYFFDIGDGQVFCLRHVSQAPENDSDWERWPNSDFDVIHPRTHPFTFREIWCRGEKLIPSHTIDQHEEYLWHILPEDHVYNGTLTTIKHDLERLNAAGHQ